MSLVDQIGLVASIALPLWNIPLIIKIARRKSSSDISLSWVLGVWICILLMAPSGFSSKDVIWKAFNITNLILFTGVVIVVFKYRKKI